MAACGGLSGVYKNIIYIEDGAERERERERERRNNAANKRARQPTDIQRQNQTPRSKKPFKNQARDATPSINLQPKRPPTLKPFKINVRAGPCALLTLHFPGPFSVSLPSRAHAREPFRMSGRSVNSLKLRNRFPHVGTWIPDSRAFQPVPGRKFHVESEFEVKISGFQRPGTKNKEKLIFT